MPAFQSLALALVGALLLAACVARTEEPVQVDWSEVVTHRRHSAGVVRLTADCHYGFPDHFGYRVVEVRMRVDAAGRVIEAEALPLNGRPALLVSQDGAKEELRRPTRNPLPECAERVAATAQTWRYQTFEREGRAVEAEFVERIWQLPELRWREPRRPFPEVSDLNSVQITLGRDTDLYECTDGHPRYEVSLSGNGSFAITTRPRLPAGNWGEPVQLARGRIETAQVETIIARLRAADFYSLLDTYVSGFTHQPGYRLTININGRRASVDDYLGEAMGMPPGLREIAAEIDRAVGAARWTCSREPPVLSQPFPGPPEYIAP